MYIGQVVKAKQLIVRPNNEIASKNKSKSKIVKGKIVYITKNGIIGLDLGRYKESFRKEDIMEV